MARGPRDDELDELRRLTVRVVLFLLGFVVIGNFVDDIYLGNRYTADPGLFTLMGGIIAGLFVSSALLDRVRNIRGGRRDDDDDPRSGV